ncbi:alpha/beta hydrolase [Lactiplantibacillus carotarum]|uniref:alpha/beta hydrolase n=1 Tax=Lactiplantibacillus carotarum TaxID=2993456 RepID=UPI00298EEE0A|nr:alpha/beta hydrolase [Lactiplantibacillus carotarum]
MKATTKQILVVTAWFTVLLAVIGGTMLWQHQVRKPRHAVTAVTVTSTERIPTLLLLDPVLDAEQQRQLVATMQRNNGSQSVMTIKAFKNGTLKFSGSLRDSDNRPYLNIQLPTSLSAKRQAELIQAIVTTAESRFKFSCYNLVSYGQGGLIATHYLENTTKQLTPRHFIAIAAPFNGTDTSDNDQSTAAVALSKRTATLKRLVTKRGIINPKIKVLIIAGNAKGRRNGDGVVPVQSALAAQSIFKPIVKNYQQTVIHSWQAGHASLPGSWKLGNAIQEFMN